MTGVIAVGKWKGVWMCNGFVRILRHLPTVTRAVYSHEWGVKICAHLLGGKDAQSELLCFELSYLRNTALSA